MKPASGWNRPTAGHLERAAGNGRDQAHFHQPGGETTTNPVIRAVEVEGEDDTLVPQLPNQPVQVLLQASSLTQWNASPGVDPQSPATINAVNHQYFSWSSWINPGPISADSGGPPTQQAVKDVGGHANHVVGQQISTWAAVRVSRSCTYSKFLHQPQVHGANLSGIEFAHFLAISRAAAVEVGVG